jgi:hypothetical protein
LLAIAVLGIVMLQSFDYALDARLPLLHLPPSVLEAVEMQRSKLAGAEIPGNTPQMRDAVREAIALSFVHAFRRVMFVGTFLALGSAIMAWALIEARKETPKAA